MPKKKTPIPCKFLECKHNAIAPQSDNSQECVGCDGLHDPDWKPKLPSGTDRMTTEEIVTIIDDRFSGWKAKLADTPATPVMLIGVGHNENNGALVVVTVEDITDAELLVMAQNLVELLAARVARATKN